ncbi:3-hydroxybutyrate dehydrogenase [Fusarium oxysporum f. sp. raphani 54005]|uniref:3-hydroxybutyrate dehydrogenase n=2 Tax=Fusarium oxysporum f. sp. raphani TaxID=96318 RepID=X0BDA1_FUSOX|nr:3-hydroxybutyrate dehydrogenase [Fusarium oxysporum f. sp. raphani 54005]KAG7424730.1 15-hydroxyprostaglandin dehydrogenase [Fusarium oxysporum f. sp. raphani]
MSFTVKGKTAVVTGAGSGICYHFSKVLLERGCNVVMADLALRPEASELLKAFPSQALFQPTDVTKWDQLDHAFQLAKKEFGGYDIVCPGAGVYEPPFSNFWHPASTALSKDVHSASRFASIDINFTHPIYATQQAIAHFTQNKKPGSIVHISSIAAQGPVLSVPMYCAAKAGISHFVRSLAGLETPPASTDLASIRVTAVAPGVIKTPLWTEHPEKLAWIDGAKDEWVEPEDVALAMLSLVEKDEYVGGTVLEVGKNQTREVHVLNDVGPSGSGHTVSGLGNGVDEVWEILSQKRHS